MQVMETSADGLKRTLKVVVGASELNEQFSARLGEIKERVQLKGFRKGKVPVAHLKKVYGRSLMAEVVQKAVEETSKKALEERKERPALTPQIVLPEDKDEIDRVIEGKADLSYVMSFEVLPPIPLADYAALKLERLVTDVTGADVDKAIGDLAQRHVTYEPAGPDRAAALGDRLTIDYVGKIGGEAFEGGASEDTQIVLGRAGYIPGFEDGLVGAKAGEARTVRAGFPTEYPVKEFAGQEAVFDVVVKEIARPVEPVIDDALAQSIGVETLDKLKELVRARIAAEYAAASRQKIKRELLDALDKAHDFELPASLVGHEAETIWRQLEATMKREGKTFADEGKTEDETREEYRRIAERRVRLGLVLGDIGEKHGIQVTPDELRRALVAQTRRFPGQEKFVYRYFEKTPGALTELRAPIFEDKVVDAVLARANPEERKVDKEEFFRLVAETEEAGHAHHEHPHGHAHPHDHDHPHPHSHDHAHAHPHDKVPE